MAKMVIPTRNEQNKQTLKMASNALAPGEILLVLEWDRSMSNIWGIGEEDLVTPEQIVFLLPGLEIEIAETRQVEDMFPCNDDYRYQWGRTANIAYVRTKKKKIKSFYL